MRREPFAHAKAQLDGLRSTLAGIPAFIREMSLVELSRVASTRSTGVETGEVWARWLGAVTVPR